MTTTWAEVFMPLPSVVGRDAALGDPARDERLELLGDRRLHRRRLVGLEERFPEPVGLRWQLWRAGFLPRLVVPPVAEHRLVERRAVTRLRVLRAEEMAAWPDLGHRPDRQRVV